MKAEVVLDLQFGSTGKGLVCAYLGEQARFDAAVCAWGPNSGHTAYVGGVKVVHTTLPLSGAVAKGPRALFLAPGSVIDPECLRRDAESLAALRDGRVDVYIHEHAAVVDEACRAKETTYAFKIGSTQTGTGEALMRKIRRGVPEATAGGHDLSGSVDGRVFLWVLPGMEWEAKLYERNRVLVEGSQGFSLGLNSGFWPHCTSRECSLAQILSDCLIAPSCVERVHGVARTFPIRVANRYNDAGEMVGSSGPGYEDQHEITWEEIGVPVEQTTVTKLPRRVFTFSRQQVRDALRRNDVTDFYLTFCNYLDSDPVWALAKARHILGQCDVSQAMLGFGPRGCEFWPFKVGEDPRPAVDFVTHIKQYHPELFPEPSNE